VPMPSTRYARYLFYRRRALKRVKRARARHVSLASDYTHKTERVFDLSSFSKQMPRVFPQRVVGAVVGGDPQHYPFVVSAAAYRMPPHATIFWVLVIGGQPVGHARFEYVVYHRRRVLSIAPLKQIPKRPYVYPLNPARPDWYYPFSFYPSGAPSYRSTL
jgi:hypothetical protein